MKKEKERFLSQFLADQLSLSTLCGLVNDASAERAVEGLHCLFWQLPEPLLSQSDCAATDRDDKRGINGNELRLPNAAHEWTATSVHESPEKPLKCNAAKKKKKRKNATRKHSNTGLARRGNAQHHQENLNTAGNLEDIHSDTVMINLYL